MTNPTSYTDEQVLELIELCSKGPTQAGIRHMGVSAVLRSLLADRLRLQAEVEALRWVPLILCHTEAPLHFNKEEALAWTMGFIDCRIRINDYRATPNETKESKS